MIVTVPDSSQQCYPQIPESTTPVESATQREPALNIGAFRMKVIAEKVPTTGFLKMFYTHSCVLFQNLMVPPSSAEFAGTRPLVSIMGYTLAKDAK